MGEFFLGLYGFIGAYFGWKLLNKAQAALGLTFFVSNALHFLFAKFLIATLIGMVTAPFQILYIIVKPLINGKAKGATKEDSETGEG